MHQMHLTTCEINKETFVFSEIAILKLSLVEIGHSDMLYDNISTIWIIKFLVLELMIYKWAMKIMRLITSPFVNKNPT